MAETTPYLLVLDRRLALWGLLGGGVALGFGVHAKADGVPAINLQAYVEIAPSGEVVIYTPGAEMGQGVSSSLPKILAEELGVDWARVSVRLSGADDRFKSPVNKKQRSGNSDAVSSYYIHLRTIGAGLREMLIAAAAQIWAVPTTACKAQGGMVLHAESGRSLSFGALAAAAAKQTPPASPILKDPKDFTLIGKSSARKDIPAKVFGSALFGVDVRHSGMLHAVVRHSPVLGAKIARYDKDKLLRQRGVKAVVELVNAIAVVADTHWHALHAIEMIDVVADPPVGPLLTSASLSAQLHDALGRDADARTWPSNVKGPLKPVNPGPTLAALREGALFEAVYEAPYLAHATMEPPCCTALVTPTACTVWGPLQAADAPRLLVAKQTGLPPEAVQINRTFLGGGFGRKWENDFLIQAVSIAQALLGIPVNLLWSREEDIRNDAYRPAFVARTRAVMGADGRPNAVHTRVTGQSIFAAKGVVFNPELADPNAALGSIADFYDIPHKLIDYVEVKTPITVGYWRSVAMSQNAFFGETAIDEMAFQAKQDPVAYRDAMLGAAPRMRRVLKTAAEAANWGAPLPPGWGRGVALSQMDRSVMAQIAEVEVQDDKLRVHRIVCAFDCGLQIDPDNVVAQMEGGIVFGLSATLFGMITVAQGGVVEGNFDRYRMVTLANTPKIDVHLVASNEPPSGVGEAATPGVAPAVCNAIFSATGKRLRSLPVSSSPFKV